MMCFIRDQQSTLLGMFCGWSKLLSGQLQGGLRVIEMERTIKDSSVQIFLLPPVKIKDNRKIISEEIACVFFFSDEKNEIIVVNIQQSRSQNSKWNKKHAWTHNLLQGELCLKYRLDKFHAQFISVVTDDLL